MDTIIQFTIPGVVFLLTLASGFWLSSAGKPYNGILFNLHKLTALGAVIATVIQLAKVLNSADSLSLVIALLVVAMVCIVALFASGALMSMGKANYGLLLTVHRIAPALLAIAMALVACMLGRKP